MTKKLMLLPLLFAGMLFFMGCSKDFTDPEFDLTAASSKKGPPVTETTNNLSFPAIAVDGFSITSVSTSSFTVSYTGEYTGLTADEIVYLESNGPWYPQKTTGNTWSAESASLESEDVTFIDWGDNIESVYPKIRTPFRLEVTLYKELENTMTGYTMAVLEYPSSSNELQGTNATTYNGSYASVISADPKLVIQFLGSSVPEVLGWDASLYRWVREDASVPSVVPVSFAPELNVGGKYIYGASSGGWKPTSLGYYRITFYVPSGSGVNLRSGTIANASTGFTGAAEGTAATPVNDTDNNLTYVDVLVKPKGGR